MDDDSIRCRFCKRAMTDVVCPCGREEIPHDVLGSEDLERVLRERDELRAPGPRFGARAFESIFRERHARRGL